MAPPSEFFLLIGAILLSSLALDYFGRRTRLPRVTVLLLFGVLIGPSGLDFFSDYYKAWFPLVTDIALLMVGFLLGSQLSNRNLQKYGRHVLSISLVAALMTGLVVFSGLLLFGVGLEIALLLAGIATSTAPAATTDVVHEMRVRGPFSKTLLGVVALDDAWGLIIFSLMLAAASIYAGDGTTNSQLLVGAWDIAGAVLVGVGLGIPAAFLTGRIHSGEPTLVEALGVIFLCGGISLAVGVSLLLAVMVMGATIANLAKHHRRPFHEIEHVEWPFMILFFVLAGASLHVDALYEMGLVGVAYVLFRSLGKLSGAWFGAVISHAPASLRNLTGIALMPQAGIALGMALIANYRFPDSGSIILNVVVGAVVVFELIGPILTRFALLRSGDETELK